MYWVAVALVDSLLTAMVRANGDALVMHVGEKPIVVAGSKTIDLSTHGLNFGAMVGMLAQLLPGDAQSLLAEFGAVEHHLPSRGTDHFTVVAARGGDDIWIEIRRRRDRDAARATHAPVNEPPAATHAPEPAPTPVGRAASETNEATSSPEPTSIRSLEPESVLAVTEVAEEATPLAAEPAQELSEAAHAPELIEAPSLEPRAASDPLLSAAPITTEPISDAAASEPLATDAPIAGPPNTDTPTAASSEGEAMGTAAPISGTPAEVSPTAAESQVGLEPARSAAAPHGPALAGEA